MLVTAVIVADTVATSVTQTTLAPRNTGASSGLKGSPKVNQITMKAKMHKRIIDPDIRHRSDWEIAATSDSTEPRTDDMQYIEIDKNVDKTLGKPIHLGEENT